MKAPPLALLKAPPPPLPPPPPPAREAEEPLAPAPPPPFPPVVFCRNIRSQLQQQCSGAKPCRFDSLKNFRSFARRHSFPPGPPVHQSATCNHNVITSNSSFNIPCAFKLRWGSRLCRSTQDLKASQSIGLYGSASNPEIEKAPWSTHVLQAVQLLLHLPCVITLFHILLHKKLKQAEVALVVVDK